MIINNFKNKLTEAGIIVSDQQLSQFETYYQLLFEWNQKMNLTAIIEKEAVFEKHFFDSIIIMEKINFANKNLADVGTGAGFPGIPLKIMNPTLKLTLIEPMNKRCKFLIELVKQLNLKDVVILNKRAEDLKELKNSFDFVTSRAVARLSILLEITSFLIKLSGTLIALKGKNYESEITEARNAFIVLNLTVDNIQKLNLWSNNDYRANLLIKKTKLSNDDYPRNFGQIKKSPL